MTRASSRARDAPPRIALALVVLVAAGCVPRDRPPSLTRRPVPPERPRSSQESDLQLETFDTAWRRIAQTRPDFGELDWEAVREELRPRARAARTAAELRPVLQDMLSRLGESHFGIIPGSARARLERLAGGETGAGGPAEIGLDVRPTGERVLVTRVEPGGPADVAGARTGWVLLSIDGRAVAELVEAARAAAGLPGLADAAAWRAVSTALRGAAGSLVELELLHGGDHRAVLEVERQRPAQAPYSFGNLPPMPADLHREELRGGVESIRFPAFLLPVARPFSRAVRGAVRREAPGVIIDLRGNPGGVAAMVTGMAGHFVEEPGRSLGTLVTRDTRLELAANPRASNERFDGPVAILVDELSASTSELLAAGLQQLGRARVFGRRTAGMALPSVIEELPNGDRLQFATADLVAPDGRRLEGRGVEPDVVVPLRREDLLAGRDAVLEAALEWILREPSSRRSGDARP